MTVFPLGGMMSWPGRECDAWAFALNRLRCSPLRTWAAVAASSWGIMFLVLFHSLLQELKRADMELVSSTSVGERILTFPRVPDQDLAESLACMKIQGLALYPWVDLGTPVSGEHIMGVGESFFTTLGSFRVLRGRPMQSSDILDRSHTCWISDSKEKALKDAGSSLKELDLRHQPFEITGVFSIQRKRHPMYLSPIDPWGEDPILVPITTAVETLADEGSKTSMLVRVTDASSVLEILDQIHLSLEELGMNTQEASDSQQRTYPGWMEEVSTKQNRAVNALQWLILIFAWIAASNVMMSQRRERIREIGLLKAVGARPFWLFAHFLRESILVGLLSGVLGILMGIFLALAIGQILGWTVKIDLSCVRLGMVVSVVASLIAGIIPAWLGADMDPVQALRHE